MLEIKAIFPAESYTREQIDEIVEANDLQSDDTNLSTFTIIEIIECFHDAYFDPKDERRPYLPCDLQDDDHETIAEFRNDVADGSRFYLDA